MDFPYYGNYNGGYMPYYGTRSAPASQPAPISTGNAPIQTQMKSNIIWVSGKGGANDYYIAEPNVTVLLMDRDSDKLYLKSTDEFGRPLALNEYNYQKCNEDSQTPLENVPSGDATEFVTRKEFEELKARLEANAPKKTAKPKKEDEVNE